MAEPHRIGIITCVARAWPMWLSAEGGLVGRAIARGVSHVDVIDLRDFGHGIHRTIDDAPFGGGAGMVLAAPPLLAAIAHARTRIEGPVYVLAPRGRPFCQADARRLSGGAGFTLICGRYEGIDERVYAAVDGSISLGDFVLSGGDPAAWAIVDAVVRLREGTLGNAQSLQEESFGASRAGLQHPVYTRPSELEAGTVPEVLFSGDHARIDAWRQQAAADLTQRCRPDLLADAQEAAAALPKSPRRW